MNAALDVLRRFAQKQAAPDQVMRTLVEYDGWFAPGGWASEIFETDTFERACIWGQPSTIPPGQLWLFTDPEAGPRVQARGASPGFYAGPLRGATIFSHLPEGIVQVEINPGSAPDQAWFIGAPGVPFARSLGKAVALERTLVTGKGNVVDQLIDFDRYILLITPQGSVATAVGAAGMTNPALVFTSVEALAAGFQAIGPTTATLKQAVLTGKELFADVARFGVDGLLLNAAGPVATKPLDLAMCKAIGEAFRARAELARLEALASGES